MDQLSDKSSREKQSSLFHWIVSDEEKKYGMGEERLESYSQHLFSS